MKRIKLFVAAAVLSLGMSSALLAPAGAINVFPACNGNDKTTVCNAKDKDSASTLIQNIVNTLLFLVGVVSVIMIIIGGIRYTLTAGDASQIKSAKDTVLYAVIGLVVSLLAYAIVNFVVARF
jgi:hypothetical protein